MSTFIRRVSRLRKIGVLSLSLSVPLFMQPGCSQAPPAGSSAPGSGTPGSAAPAGLDLTGAWEAQITFHDGAFAAIHDLRFLYAFNAGGTMTESSNYDAVPPVPPAYGIWRAAGGGSYEASYTFYTTRPPASLDEIARGGGWPPAGHGVLTEHISLSDDGQSFTSELVLVLYDQDGRQIEGGGTASGRASRMRF
jgi:hypothetical protein